MRSKARRRWRLHFSDSRSTTCLPTRSNVGAGVRSTATSAFRPVSALKLSLRNPDQLDGFDLGQAAFLDQAMQLGDDAGFQQPFFRVGQTKIGEHIAAALVGFDFAFGHGSRRGNL